MISQYKTNSSIVRSRKTNPKIGKDSGLRKASNAPTNLDEKVVMSASKLQSETTSIKPSSKVKPVKR